MSKEDVERMVEKSLKAFAEGVTLIDNAVVTFKDTVTNGLGKAQNVVDGLSDLADKCLVASRNVQDAANTFAQAMHSFSESADLNRRAAQIMSEAAESMVEASHRMQG